MVTALGPDEVSSMLAEQGKAVMNCGFCNETYTLPETELNAIISRA
jgi:redox-regulated HSP33 family molecular chaperone